MSELLLPPEVLERAARERDAAERRAVESGPVRRHEWIVVALLVVVLASITGPRVFNVAIWGDEFRTWRDGIEKPLSLILTWKHNPDHAPMGHLLARIGASIFGVEHPWALRLGSWLCGLACVPALFWMGRSLWGGPAGGTVGLLVAGMFVVDANIGYQMTQARMYAPLMLAGVGAIGFAGLLITRPDRPGWRMAMLGVTLALGIWSHGQIYAVVIALLLLGVGLLFDARRRRVGVALLIGLAVGLALGAQGVAKIIGRHDAEAVVAGDIQGPPREQLATAVEELTGKSGHTVLIVGASIAGLVVIARRRRFGPLTIFFVLIIAATILNLFIAAKYRPIAHARYLTILQPPLWVAMAVLLVELWRARRRAWYVRALAIAGTLVLVWLGGLGGKKLKDLMGGDAVSGPFRTAALEIKAKMGPNDRFAVVARSPFAMYCRYYGLSQDKLLDEALMRQKPSQMTRAKNRAKLEEGTIWVLGVRPVKSNRRTIYDPPYFIQMVAEARKIDFGDEIALIKKESGWRTGVVKIDATSVDLLDTYNRHD